MVDFEHGNKAFRRSLGWTEQRKQALFNRLLDIIDRRVRAFFGTGAFMKDPRRIPPTYDHNITKTIGKVTMQVRSWRAWGEGDTGVRIVFAKHPQRSAARIIRWCDRLRMMIPEFDGGVVAEPRDMPPLQVADIVTYEYTRTEGNPIERYPMRYMYGPGRLHNFFWTPFVTEA